MKNTQTYEFYLLSRGRDGNGQSGGLPLSSHFARVNPAINITAATAAMILPPMGVQTRNAEKTAVMARISSIRSLIVSGTATTT